MMDDYTLIIFLEFVDGTANVMRLHQGTLKSCAALMKQIPAISCSGSKHLRESNVLIVDTVGLSKFYKE